MTKIKRCRQVYTHTHKLNALRSVESEGEEREGWVMGVERESGMNGGSEEIKRM